MKIGITFPKLPFPMARRIWKWSKLTAKKLERTHISDIFTRTCLHTFCVE